MSATERYNLRFTLEHREQKKLQRQVPIRDLTVGVLFNFKVSTCNDGEENEESGKESRER
ncbi:MAG: hypothetical protein PHE70_00335 [Tepidanaerobacteraceae bacterium]|nr:hypothetical protein [Tepidanaerobacteraceae bacterium]